MSTDNVVATTEPTPVADVKPVDPNQPKPPYKFVGKVSPGTVLCARCALPAGKLAIIDSLQRRFGITANTNFVKIGDNYVHENLRVCAMGMEIAKEASLKTSEPATTETSSPAAPQPQA